MAYSRTEVITNMYQIVVTDENGNITGINPEYVSNITTIPAGNINEVQISGGNVVVASSNFTFNPTSNTLTATNINGDTLTASYFVGDGTGISNVTTERLVADISNVQINGGYENYVLTTNGSGNLSWALPAEQYSNSNVANYLPTYTGILSGDGANISNIGNANSANIANVANVAYSVAGANVSGTVANATYATSAGSADSVAGANVSGTVSSATTAGTVTTNAQPNITSTGTLTGLDVSGNITASRFISNVGTGTAPFVVSSGTLVNNLFVARANIATYIVPVADTANTTNQQVYFGANANGQIKYDPSFYYNSNTNTLNVGNSITFGSNITGPQFVSNIATGTEPLIVSSTTRVANLNVATAGIADSATVAASANAVAGSNVSGQVANALVASTVYTAAQPNITSTGTLTVLNVSGDTSITGNLTVNGNLQYTNVNNLYIKDPLIEIGGSANNTPLTTNDGKDRGELLHYYTTEPVNAFMGWDNSNAEFAFGRNVTNSVK